MEWTRGRTVGRGSSANVSAATSRHSGDTFAVKSVELSLSGILQREQRILSSLSSPHVVGYIGCEITNESNKLVYNLLMEYLPGGTIANISRSRRLKEPAIGFYTRQIVQGLEYLHSSGLAHCDIKGQNIIVGEKSGAKIADFGCARWLNAAEEEAAIGGTPMYFAPEVARGEEQGCPADIWALGCTVIEMATGGPPWTRVENPVSVLYRIGFSGEIPEVPGFLSDEGKDFLSKCLRTDPRERWTARQLLRHPFLRESSSNSEGKQILEEFVSDSPTCVLDQGVWSSIEERESLGVVTCEGIRSDSPAERIGRLSSGSGVPDWRWDGDWIRIRSSIKGDGISNELEVEDVWCGDLLIDDYVFR